MLDPVMTTNVGDEQNARHHADSRNFNIKERSLEKQHNPVSTGTPLIAATIDRTAAMAELNQWIDEDLTKSGLTRDDIEIVPFAPRMLKGKAVNNGGYGIIYRDADGEEMRGMNGHPFVRERYRPPLPESKGVKMKYGTPPHAGIRCFFPQGIHAFFKNNQDAPLYLTEGEKKAAKCAKEGFPIVGLAGIWGWLASIQERRGVSDKYKLNADLLPFLHAGRDVVIIYDSDSTDTRNKANGFESNTLHLACQLLECGCNLYRVDVPADSDEKCGLDDYLKLHSADDFRRHVDETKQLIHEEDALAVLDPYKEITKQEGEPFLIKWTQANEVSKVTLTQGWNARFLMENHRILFEPCEGQFYLYNEENGLWESKTEDCMKTLLGSDLGVYWRKYHAAAAQYLLPSRSDRILKDSISRLKGISERLNAFTVNGEKYPVIHLKEGMLDLRTMELNEFSPEYFSRNQIPVSFDEKADCPRFLNDLLAPALSDDAISVLKKYFGMCVLGYNYSQQFLLLEGTPGGGKGTLTSILRRIVGEMNVAEVRTSLLNERFEMAAFCGKSLLVGSDVPGNFLQRSGAEALKKLTGHDLIEAEFKGANRRATISGVFNAVITSNNRLRVRLDGDEEAWRRRLILVRFSNPPAEKLVTDFAGILLKEEGSGILNWMIQGATEALDDFRERGKIIVPDTIQNNADELLYESNSLNNFLDERVLATPGGNVATSELQNAYISYCNSLNIPAMGLQAVASRLAALLKDKFGAVYSNMLVRGVTTVRGYKNIELVAV